VILETIAVYKRLALLLGVFFIYFPINIHAQNNQQNEAEVVINQSNFEIGLQKLFNKEYKEASEIFENLYVKTKSPRVKLEWARALYLQGNRKQSEKLFNEVLALDPPMMVREKIGGYLEDISVSTGKLEANVGFIKDTNPRFVTNNQTINLFGQSYSYNPGFDTSPKYGTSYFLSGAKGLDDKNEWVLGFGVNGASFSDKYFNRTDIETSASYRFLDIPKMFVKLSYENYLYGDRLLYKQPALSIKHQQEESSGSYWTNELKIGQLSYPEYSYLNGNGKSYSTSFGLPITTNLTSGLELGIDRTEAKENAYTFTTKSIGWVTNFYQPEIFIKGQLKFVESFRKYGDLDPMFYEIRKESKSAVYLTIIKTDWKVLGVSPSLDLGFEKNNSNIGLYSYKRSIVNLYFKKIY